MYDHDPWGDDDAWGEPGPHTDELADLDYTGPLDEQNDADGTASLTDVDDAPEAESLLLVSACRILPQRSPPPRSPVARYFESNWRHRSSS